MIKECREGSALVKRHIVVAMSVTEADMYDTVYFGRALLRPSLDVRFCLGDAAEAASMIRTLSPGMLFVCSAQSILRLEELLDTLPLNDKIFVSAIVPDSDDYNVRRLIRRGVFCLPHGSAYMVPAGAANMIAARFLQFAEQNLRR